MKIEIIIDDNELKKLIKSLMSAKESAVTHNGSKALIAETAAKEIRIGDIASIRVANILKAGDINNLYDLLRYVESNGMPRFRYMGTRARAEVVKIVDKYRLV